VQEQKEEKRKVTGESARHRLILIVALNVLRFTKVVNK